jgi:hypothetical protein
MNNTSESIQLNKPSLINDRSVKTIINWTPEPGVNLGTRIEYKVLTPTGEKGMALSQDIIICLKGYPSEYGSDGVSLTQTIMIQGFIFMKMTWFTVSASLPFMMREAAVIL